MPTTRAAVANTTHQTFSTRIVDELVGAEWTYLVFPSEPATRYMWKVELGHESVGSDERRRDADRTLNRDRVPSAPRPPVPTPELDVLRELLGSPDVPPPKSIRSLAELDQWIAKEVRGSAERGESEAIEGFVRTLLFSPLIPFRLSPISGTSLSHLFLRFTPGSGAGAIAGYFAAPDSALMLLTLPGGMLVGGTAYGVATALEKGLHERILALITPKSPPEPESPPTTLP
jgi:hypothetical protein